MPFPLRSPARRPGAKPPHAPVRRSVRLDIAPANGAPPTAFRLFRFGANQTTKGVFTLTPAGAAGAIAQAEAHGADLAIDYNHAMVDAASADPALAGRAAGWFRLALRPDGLWATRVNWTSEAALMVSARQYRYISPAFYTNDDNEIVEIINAAITNLPASFGLTPLVAHRAGRTNAMKVVAADDVHAHADKIGELAETMDSAKLKTLSQGLHDLASGGKDVADEPDADDAPAEEKKAPVAASETASVPSAASAVAVAKQELARLRAEAEATAEAETEAAAPQGDESVVALAKKLTGKSDPSEVRGTLLAIERGNREYKELLGKFQKNETELRRYQAEEVVRLASKDGKVKPFERAALVKLGIADMAELKADLAERIAVKTAASATKPSEDEGEKLSQVRLSIDEEKMLKTTGVSREKYLAQKTRVAHLGGPDTWHHLPVSARPENGIAARLW